MKNQKKTNEVRNKVAAAALAALILGSGMPAKADIFGDIFDVITAPVRIPVQVVEKAVTGQPVTPAEVLTVVVPPVAPIVEIDRQTGVVTDGLHMAEDAALLPVHVGRLIKNLADRSEEAKATIEKANDALDATKGAANAAEDVLKIVEGMLQLANKLAEEATALLAAPGSEAELKANADRAASLLDQSMSLAQRALSLLPASASSEHAVLDREPGNEIVHAIYEPSFESEHAMWVDEASIERDVPETGEFERPWETTHCRY
ncbi:MAG: hypothetical protein QM778_18495 [Myxococcales bacterium]